MSECDTYGLLGYFSAARQTIPRKCLIHFLTPFQHGNINNAMPDAKFTNKHVRLLALTPKGIYFVNPRKIRYSEMMIIIIMERCCIITIGFSLPLKNDHIDRPVTLT